MEKGNLAKTQRKTSGPVGDASVNGIPVAAKIDSGAAMSVIGNKLAVALQDAGVECEPTNATLSPAGNSGNFAHFEGVT